MTRKEEESTVSVRMHEKEKKKEYHQSGTQPLVRRNMEGKIYAPNIFRGPIVFSTKGSFFYLPSFSALRRYILFVGSLTESVQYKWNNKYHFNLAFFWKEINKSRKKRE